MTEDLNCARCGHRREEHAEFIDRTISTMSEAAERRACQHINSKDAKGRPVYCECHLFVSDEQEPPHKKALRRKPPGLSAEEELKRWRDLTVLLPHNFEECNSPPWCQVEDYIKDLKAQCLRLQKQVTFLEVVGTWEADDEVKKIPAMQADEIQEAADLFTETRQSILGVDCRECGVCCCPPAESGKKIGDGQAYVELTHADLVRLGAKAERYLVKGKGRSRNTSGYFLQAYKGADGRACCPFFTPPVEHQEGFIKGGCGIYEIRPLACQLWEKGGQGCREARRKHPHTNSYLRSLPYKKKSLGKEF